VVHRALGARGSGGRWRPCAGGRFTELDRNGLLDSLAIHLGGETPLGPACVGLGLSSQGRAKACRFVGMP
jgi:NTE family protein